MHPIHASCVRADLFARVAQRLMRTYNAGARVERERERPCHLKQRELVQAGSVRPATFG